jgi:hypothetical protein
MTVWIYINTTKATGFLIERDAHPVISLPDDAAWQP